MLHHQRVRGVNLTLNSVFTLSEPQFRFGTKLTQIRSKFVPKNKKWACGSERVKSEVGIARTFSGAPRVRLKLYIYAPPYNRLLRNRGANHCKTIAS